MTTTTPFLFVRDEPSDRRRALLGLAAGLAFGAGSTALFWNARVGLNLFLWTLATVGANALAHGRRAARPLALGTMTTALVVAFAVVRFESPWALGIAGPTVLLLLAALPLVLHHELGFAALDRVGRLFVASARSAGDAAGDVGALPARALGTGASARVPSALKGLVVGLPIAGIFAVLFAGDHDFARAVGAIRDELGDAFVFACEALVLGVTALGVHFAHARAAARASELAVAFDPYRAAGDGEASARPKEATDDANERRSDVVVRAQARPLVHISPLTWSIILAQVVLVFAIFVAANLRHLFGGVAIIRAEASTTYASYLHAGFGQLLVATVLAVCLVLAGHALVHDGERARGRAVVALEIALLGCAGVIVASASQRLAIYVDAYGASYLRLGVAFIEVAIAGLLLLTAAKSLLPRWRGYAAAVLAFAVLLATAASQVNADSAIANENLDRVLRGKRLDYDYLGMLTTDAASALDHPAVHLDPRLALFVERTVCAKHPRSWREFRGLEQCPASDSPTAE